MTKPATSSATEFSSDAQSPTRERPVVTIVIGDVDYVVRCPKMKTWLESGFLLERIDRCNSAAKRIKDNPIMAAPERRELEALVATAPDPQTIHETIIDGRLVDGVIEGGFLRRCMGEDNYRDLKLRMDQDDSEVDTLDLYSAALSLYFEFEPWFVAQTDELGMMAPQAKRAAGARAPLQRTPGATPGTRSAAKSGARPRKTPPRRG